MTAAPRVAFFVSPHGFGHAARACAVAQCLAATLPEIRIGFVTTVPEWFFRDSLPGLRFDYVELAVDVGLVQRDSLHVDLEATASALVGVLPPAEDLVSAAVQVLDVLEVDMAIADIAPLGLLAAKRRGVPAVLVENFTWDWIYDSYLDEAPSLRSARDAAREAFAAADVHVQTLPWCSRRPGAVGVGPIAREPRSDPGDVRGRLGVGADTPLVVMSMGGMPWRFGTLDELAGLDGHVVAIGDLGEAQLPPNVTALTPRSSFFHPDLLHAADALVGKLGYSTVAEALHAGCRYAVVERPGFPEYGTLLRHVETHSTSCRIIEADFRAGRFGRMLSRLLDRPAPQPLRATGASEVAELVARALAPTAR